MVAKHAAIMDAAKAMETDSLRERKRADAASGGSAPMDDYYAQGVDIGYSANLTIGTPGQLFNMVPDSESRKGVYLTVRAELSANSWISRSLDSRQPGE